MCVYNLHVKVGSIDKARLIDADVVHNIVGDDHFITTENLLSFAISC
jgi:hypothetical protein